MACFAPWVFRDNTGQTWALGMNAAGQLTFSLISNPPANNAAASVPLQDTVSRVTVALSVVFTTFPKLTPTPSTGPAIGSFIPLTRPGVGTYWLQVASGALVLNQKDSAAPADPVVGQLYNADMVNPALIAPNLPNAGLPSGFPGGWLVNYKQPGGIATPTFPAQAQGSQSMITGVPFEVGMGMNVGNCGHSLNCWEIAATTISCGPAFVVRCPLCGAIQQIISPASRLFTDPGLEHISS